MHPNKRENLLNLSPEARVEFFIRHVADFEEVWTVINPDGDFILIEDEKGKSLLLVWTHEAFAEMYMLEEQRQQNGLAAKISVYEFADELALELAEHDIDIGVFFDNNRSGHVLNGRVLSATINEEIDTHL